MSQVIIENAPTSVGLVVREIPMPAPSFVSKVSPQRSQSPYTKAVKIRATHEATIVGRQEWLDEEFRQAYAEAAVEQGIAWQIRANRRGRCWTQDDLARMLDTKQSAVSRLEDPEYGGHSLETLVKVAHAFDCALSVKFVSYSELAREAEDLSDTVLFAKPFCDERDLFGDAQ